MTATLIAFTTDALATLHEHGDGSWFPWFPVVPLFFVAIWITVFALVSRRWRRFAHPSPEHVLAERYARGEIDEDEYRQRRTVLRRKD